MVNEFLILSVTYIFAVASPGADFALVLKNTLRSGKSVGLATAFGIGLGILVHFAYTLFGIAIVLAQSDSFFTVVKAIGSGYLLWLAYNNFRSRPRPEFKVYNDKSTPLGLLQAVRQGFLVNILNVKVTLFFVALFTNIVSSTTPIWIQIAYGLLMSAYTISWFSLVAWGFSRESIAKWYRRYSHLIDWFVGFLLVLVAFRMVT